MSAPVTLRAVRPIHIPGKIFAHETLRNRHSTPRPRQHDLRRTGALRGHRLHPALGTRAARYRPPDHFGLDHAARRERAGGGDRGDGRARRGVVHDPGSAHPHKHVSGADQQHHAGVQPRSARGRGSAGRARQGVTRARTSPRRRARAGDREAVCRRAAVLLAGLEQRELRPDAALRRRRPVGEGAAAEPAGRRQRRHLRRAALLDARVGAA